MAKKKKKLNLKAPIVPGSSITEGQLGSQARASVGPTYVPLIRQGKSSVAQARNAKRDFVGPGGFYDQYLAALHAHQANVNQIATQANAATQSLTGAITGLSGAEAASQQTAANQQAGALGVTSAGDQSRAASDATAIRQTVAGSFGAEQAAQNAAAQTYADTLANVVGPGEKLTGASVAQGNIKAAQQSLKTTREKRQADITAFKQQARTDEQKNVTALTAAGLSTAAKTSAEGQTLYTSGAFNGLTHDQVRAMSPKQKANAVDAYNQLVHPPKTTADHSGDIYQSGPYAGYTKGFVQGQSQGWRNQKVNKYNNLVHPPKTGSGSGDTPGLPAGVKHASTSRIQSSSANLQQGQSTIRTLLQLHPELRSTPGLSQAERNRRRSKLGAALIAGAGPYTTYDDDDPQKQHPIRHPAIPALKGIMLTAALDQVYLDGKISRTTAHRLALLGFLPSDFGLKVLSAQDVTALDTPTKPSLPTSSVGGFPK